MLDIIADCRLLKNTRYDNTPNEPRTSFDKPFPYKSYNDGIIISQHTDSITSPVSSATNPVFKCAYSCGITTDCTHWSLDSSTSLCTLRSGEGKPVTDRTQTSGNKACSIGRELICTQETLFRIRSAVS